MAEWQLATRSTAAVVPAEAVPSRPIGLALPPHLRTDDAPVRIAVLESKVTILEFHVEALQRRFCDALPFANDKCSRHDKQVLPTEFASVASSEFEVLALVKVQKSTGFCQSRLSQAVAVA